MIKSENKYIYTVTKLQNMFIILCARVKNSLKKNLPKPALQSTPAKHIHSSNVKHEMFMLVKEKH